MNYKGYTITVKTAYSDLYEAVAVSDDNRYSKIAKTEELAISGVQKRIDGGTAAEQWVAELNEVTSGDDVSLESALEASKQKPYKPNIQYVPWEDGDYLEIEIAPEFKVGQKVRVKTHTRYWSQGVGYSTLVEPMPYTVRGGHIGTIRNVFVDSMEDEHGNPVELLVIEVNGNGLFNPDELEIVS